MDIVRDTMRLTREGKSLAETRAYINGYYSQFGEPTDTEPVP